MIPDDFTGFKLKELTRNAKTQICWRFQGAILYNTEKHMISRTSN